MIKRKLHAYETIDALKTRGQFRKAYTRNAADQSKLTTKFIEAGRGNWRPNNEIKAAADQGDAMAVDYFALTDEANALNYRAKHWFGMPPYLV
jgi:hypothetical protein